MKKELLKIINSYAVHENTRDDTMAVYDVDFEFMADDIVKFCNLQNVSQQRELFVSFARFAHNYGKGSYGTSYEEMFSEWLKKRNK